MKKERVIEKEMAYKVSKKEFLKELNINPEEVQCIDWNGSFDLDNEIIIIMKEPIKEEWDMLTKIIIKNVFQNRK